MLRDRARGFTLIEMMIVMAVIAILMAIAIPAYNSQVRSARRTTAQGCLVEMSQILERRYAVAFSYVGAALDIGCRNELNGFYDFDTTDVEARRYLLEAAPLGEQAADSCGTMTHDQTGVRTAEGDADCWK